MRTGHPDPAVHIRTRCHKRPGEFKERREHNPLALSHRVASTAMLAMLCVLCVGKRAKRGEGW